MRSVEVFSLDENLEKLTSKLAETDELTPNDVMATLENQVARAVAKVRYSELEVSMLTILMICHVTADLYVSSGRSRP